METEIRNTRDRLLVFIESDLVIRHFLNSGVLVPLFKQFNVTLVLPPKGWKRISSKVPIDPELYNTARVSIPDARRLKWVALFTLDSFRLRIGYGWWRLLKLRWAIVGWRRGIKGIIRALPIIRGISIKKIRQEIDNHSPTELHQLIIREKPQILIHPTTMDGYFINDIIDQGTLHGIPSVLLMNSWDNPSIKRAVSSNPTLMCVWGNQTQAHAIKFMGLKNSQIRKIGSAQFEVFRQTPRIDKRTLQTEHAIPLEHNILLFAASSKNSNDFLHLTWLDEALGDGKFGDWSVIYRPHPYGIPQPQAKNILEHKWKRVVIERSTTAFMKRLAENDHRGLFMADYRRTHDLLSNVDAVVSPLSTIIIEAAMHGLPVMCFSPREEPGSGIWKANKKLIHFDAVLNCPLVFKATKYSEFLSEIGKLLNTERTQKFEEQMKVFASNFIEDIPGGYADSLLTIVEELIASRQHR